MNGILRGLYAGLAAGAIVALLYFVDYGPANDLHGVARWFALDSNGSIGKLIGFILLIVLGGVVGATFGALQRNRPITLSRAIVTGLLAGLAFWLIFTMLFGTVIGHISLAHLSIGSFLYSFMLDLVFGFLLGSIYFQSTVRRPSTA